MDAVTPWHHRFDTALERRLGLLRGLGPETDAYRLIHSDADGFKGVTVDRLGPVLLAEAHTPDAEWQPLLELLQDRYAGSPIFFKNKRSADPAVKTGVQIAGPEQDPRHRIREEGLSFGVCLTGAPHIGIFLDARATRRWVRSRAEGKRMLNLFAYTGGFGVAAAAGGARATTNIDIKRSALAQAARNYAINRLRTDTRTFLKSDAAAYLKRCLRASRDFDMIILDPPPASSRTNRSRMDTRTAFVQLVTQAAGCLAAGGVLLAGLNNPRVDDDRLQEMLAAGLLAAERVATSIASIPRDADFPDRAGRPAARFFAITI